MHSYRFFSYKMTSTALAGLIFLSATVGPSLLPLDMGGNGANAQQVIQVDAFYDALAPYGQWVNTPQYGQVWYPNGVGRDWRPYYNDGHWAYSDYNGWLWVSDMPWGWAPFHYGRWAFDHHYGWIWVPGRVWGPAWVTFRQADGYIGWAPMPPESGWDPNYGYRGGDGIAISVDFWTFLLFEGFTARRFDAYAIDRHQYPTIYSQTTNITNITIINNQVVNNSVRVKDVEHFSHQKVERVRITEGDRPEQNRLNGNDVVIYKPTIVEDGDANADKNDKWQSPLIKENPVQDNRRRANKAGGQPSAEQYPEKNQAPVLNQNQNQYDKGLPAGNTTGNQSVVVPSIDTQNTGKKNRLPQQLPPTNKGGQNQNVEQPQGNTLSKQQLKAQQQQEQQQQQEMQPQQLRPTNKGGQNQNVEQPQGNTLSKQQLKAQQQQEQQKQQQIQPQQLPTTDKGGQNQNMEQPQGNTLSKQQLKAQQQGQPPLQEPNQSGKKSQICGGAGQAPCS